MGRKKKMPPVYSYQDGKRKRKFKLPRKPKATTRKASNDHGVEKTPDSAPWGGSAPWSGDPAKWRR